MSKDNIKRRYSLSEALYLAVCLIRSKLICKDIRLIRFPVVIRGGNLLNLERSLRLVTGADSKPCR